MFQLLFVALAIVAAGLFYYTKTKVETDDDPAFRSFQKTYLSVYLLAVGEKLSRGKLRSWRLTAGDWLQGPHVYALYQKYDMSKHQVCLSSNTVDLIS